MGVAMRLSERWEQAFRDHGLLLALLSTGFLGDLFVNCSKATPSVSDGAIVFA